jgi:hypothetical protein
MKGKNLKGKMVEIVPWHKTFRDKGWILTGRLVDIKHKNSVSYAPTTDAEFKAWRAGNLSKAGRVVREIDIYTIEPSKLDKDWLVKNQLMSARQRTVIRLAQGHKIRRKK